MPQSGAESRGISIRKLMMLKIGIYVDAENIRYNGGQGMRYDILRRFAAREGGALLRMNTYVTFDRQRAARDREFAAKAFAYQQMLRDNGWKVIVKDVRRYEDDEGNVRTKANADLDLAVDVLLEVANLDQVLLVTGDGDFLRLVSAIQSRGCRLELLAFENVSQELQRRADSCFSGYLVPDLVPPRQESPARWGELGSRVRGICTRWVDDKGYGFLRFVRAIGPGLWITDNRDPASPYGSVFCHTTQLRGVDAPLLRSRDTILEFTLAPSPQDGDSWVAEDVILVYAPGRGQ
jgi:uncharacterized LabA/DUF88 family protein